MFFQCLARLAPSTTLALCAVMVTGCGTIKTRSATDQLLMSDAVDRSIAQLDFSPLQHATVYLDTKYIRQVPGAGFVNADYIVAALREKIMLSGCVLEERRDEAEYIVEVRVGALGTDGHEITYGIPASQALNATANLVSSSPVMPSIPEISLAKRDERRAEVKMGVFAYHRQTKEPVWKPAAVQGSSMAKATWFFGAGPFEQGSIYESVQLAGQPINHRMPDIESRALAVLNAPTQWLSQREPGKQALNDDSSAPAIIPVELPHEVQLGATETEAAQPTNSVATAQLAPPSVQTVAPASYTESAAE